MSETRLSMQRNFPLCSQADEPVIPTLEIPQLLDIDGLLEVARIVDRIKKQDIESTMPERSTREGEQDEKE